MSAPYPRDGETDPVVCLEYVREHVEQLAMCHSCVHMGQGCPPYADAEQPCSGYEYKEDLIAENLTDDLKKLEQGIRLVKKLKKRVDF